MEKHYHKQFHLKLNKQAIHEKALKLYALDNKRNIEILNYLQEKGELCVSDIYKPNKWEQADVSARLKTLRDNNFVTNRRDSKQVYYKINTHEIQRVLRTIESI